VLPDLTDPARVRAVVTGVLLARRALAPGRMPGS